MADAASAVPVIGATDSAPPSRLREFWRAFAQNRGAVIGLVLVALLLALALGADFIAPHPPNEQFREFTLAPPAWDATGSTRFLLGTDPVGRDILSRLIHGTRLSLLIGTISVAISLTIGAILGLCAGYFRGIVDTSIMRLMDVMLALPSLLLAIAVVAILGPGLANAMYAIAVVLLPHYVRLTRAAVIAEAGRESQILRGQGDAEAIRIFADAFGQNPEFFDFYRSLQACRESMGGGSTSLVLSPDSEFFRFFNGRPVAPSQAPNAPGAGPAAAAPAPSSPTAPAAAAAAAP